MTEPRIFPIRYGRWHLLLAALGMGSRFSDVAVTPDELRVRMGWAFQARIPRSSIQRATADRNMRSGIGVHGWRGRWLVNGSVSGIVTIEIEPRVRARVIGFPVGLHTLHVSVKEPELLAMFLGR